LDEFTLVKASGREIFLKKMSSAVVAPLIPLLFKEGNEDPAPLYFTSTAWASAALAHPVAIVEIHWSCPYGKPLSK
jgi:hypothetical protein